MTESTSPSEGHSVSWLEKIFDVERDGNILVITPLVKLSEFLVEGLHDQTQNVLDRSQEEPVKHLVVDLHRCNYLASDFIALLLKLWKVIRTREGKMALCNVSGQMKEVLHICELDKIWTMCETREAALSVVSAPPSASTDPTDSTDDPAASTDPAVK